MPYSLLSSHRNYLKHFLGITLSIIVGHSVALEGFLFKFVGGSESSFKCVFYMSLWLVLFNAPVLCYSTASGKRKLGVQRDNLVNLAVVSVGMGAGLTLAISAYNFAPVADAFTLYYSNAVFSLIFESIAFRQWPQRLHILAVSMTLVGIVIVSRPPFLFDHITDDNETNGSSSLEKDVESGSSGETRFLGCSLAIAAAVTTSVWMTFTRRIEQMNVAFVTFLQALVPVIGYGLMFKMITKEQFCVSGNLVALSLLCLNYCINLPMLNVCLTLEPSYIVTSVRCLATVTSYAIQIASGSRPPWYTFVGASLIVSSVLIVSYTKWIDSPQREERLHMTTTSDKKCDQFNANRDPSQSNSIDDKMHLSKF